MTARLVIAGTHSGVGKTTVATGLMAALAARGSTVAGAKIGPDFIDPSYHQVATGTPSRNLDAVLSGTDLLAPLLAHGARTADVAIVEGVMGLFDGAARAPTDEQPPEGGRAAFASTAHVARLLDAPVVLVVDAGAMAGSVAALVHGFATWDPGVRLAGVIVNRVASDRHEEMIREALAPVGVAVLGALRRDDTLRTPSRHLGLVPVAERSREAARSVRELAAHVAAGVDLDAVLALARTAPPLPAPPWQPPVPDERHAVRIAVAGGPAFSFTYAENLELLTAAGAELVPLDPTRDERLPDGTDALYLGGGFPEAHGEALSANAALRAEVAAAARAGRPILAECGGLLYLCRSLDELPMCGVLDADARMAGRLTLGYREAEVATPGTWWPLGSTVRGHEFHHSTVEPTAGTQAAWRLVDTASPRAEGFVAGSVHASYLHTHWARTPEVAARFVAAAARQREQVRG
jgi:cobyrinic acid a,c-diamide synthase